MRALQKNVMTPIIKIVGDYCNLKCKYCFYFTKEQNVPTIMDENLLEKFIYEYLNLFDGKLRFIWHGGEPLLAGLSFFEKIIKFQKKFQKSSQTICNSIQTNATILDETWANFFKLHNIHIGISLDGPKEIHDNFRNNFDLVMNAMEILKRHEIHFGVIQTVPANNIKYSKEIFDFFVNHIKLKNWGVNIFNDVEGKNKSMTSQNVTNEQCLSFFKDYIDYWLQENDPNLRIREIENFIAGATGLEPTSCSFSGTCSKFLCLNYDGSFYPCDRLCGFSEHFLGDLSKQPLTEILNGTLVEKHVAKVNYINKDCAQCKWYKFCHNGCISQRIGGVTGKYYFCEARISIFNYLAEKVKEYKKGRRRQNDWRESIRRSD